MRGLWGIAALALVAGACQPRTEVMVGVLTDIEAPDAVDTVRLTASENGKEVFHYDWAISGVPNKPFELPGSFGIASPDGSEPKVLVRVTGLKDGQEVLHRDALMSLVHGKTLFLRMTLVKRCEPMSCGDGQTCVEGRCQPSLVDMTTLPAYVDGAEKTVSCSSGSVFIDTSTKQPVPSSGSGDCAPDEQCTEGTCYKVPSSMMSSVTGTQIDNFVSETGEITVAEDLSQVTVEALVPSGEGYQTFPGTGASDGTFTIPNVPQGTYLLHVGNTYVQTAARVIDLGTVTTGRVGATRATSVPVKYVFNVANVTPWTPNDDIEAICPGTNSFMETNSDQTGMVMPPTGATSVTNLFSPDVGGGPGGAELIDESKGDQLWIEQLHFSQLPNGNTQQVCTGFAQPPGFSTVDGQVNTINTTLTNASTDPSQLTSVSVNVRGSDWTQFAPQVTANPMNMDNAGQTINGPVFDFYTKPGPPEYGRTGVSLDLLYLSPGMGNADMTISSSFPNPQPSSWGVAGFLGLTLSTTYQLPGTANPAFFVATVENDDLPQLVTAPDHAKPLISPPVNPTIDGQPWFTPGVVPPMPTVSWSPPMIGTPTSYLLEVRQLTVKNQNTRQQLIADITTTTPSLIVPPGVLVPGNTYVLKLYAFLAPGQAPSRSPNRTFLPFSMASTLSGMFTVAGSVGGNDGGTPRDGGAAVPDLGQASGSDMGAASCLQSGATCANSSQCCSGTCLIGDGGPNHCQ